MKTLFLLRHAKSSWKDPALRDFDRPLNKRGLKDLKLVGTFMREQKISPDLVICSTAERARQTAELLLKSNGLKFELRFDQRIYEADVPRLLQVISELEDIQETVMLVGHNPGLEDLYARLTGHQTHLSTASLVAIEFTDDKWSSIQDGSGEVKLSVTPKELEEDS